MHRVPTRWHERRLPIVAVVIAVHALIAWLIVSGLAVSLVRDAGEALDLIEPPAPVALAEDPELDAPEPEGADSAPDFVAEPVPVSAPPPEIELEAPPPPIVAAPASGEGRETDSGAAEQAGDGAGGGGEGFGRGSGLSGSGTGAGIVRAQKIAGEITHRDYPRASRQAREGGTVIAHYTVLPNGRVTNCRVVRSSATSALEVTTCRLIEERFRYRPATNSRGEAVEDITGWQQDWCLNRDGGICRR